MSLTSKTLCNHTKLKCKLLRSERLGMYMYHEDPLALTATVLATFNGTNGVPTLVGVQVLER